MMKVLGNVPGTPAGGYHVVADISATNSVQAKPDDNAMDIAIAMVSDGSRGVPVVGEDYEFVGFISEGDVIRALEAGVDLNRAKACDIMNTAFVGVEENTPLASVSRLFEMGFQLLPVVQDGKVVRSITRHDVLRARLGLGPTIDEK
jgi:predicted transcriptional regulator